MAVIESNNRILRVGVKGAGEKYYPGAYIDIDQNNVISFTGDFSGLSAQFEDCCADVQGQLSSIKGSVSSLQDCCSSVNTNLDEIWSAISANSANILINSSNIYNIEGNTALLEQNKLDVSAYSSNESLWISAWKEVNNYITADFGNTFCLLSSIDVSGTMNHAVGVKGSYITLPGTAHIASALDEKFTIEGFNNFISAGFNPNINALYSNDSYLSSVINQKFDASAASSYVPYSAIGGDTNIITGINGSALSAGLTYTAGPNIEINDNEISGKDWTDEITAASANAVNEAVNNITAVSYAESSNVSNSALTANYALSSDSATYDNLGREITATYLTAVTGDNILYSAGDNIDITNHVVSGKDWTDEITAASSYAYEQATANDNTYDVSAGDNINVSTADNTFTVSGKDWTDAITAASSNAVNEAINTITAVSYAATANISNSALTANYALSSDSATYDSDGNKITETYLSAIPEDVITTADTFVSSVNNLTPAIVSGGIEGHELTLSGSFTPNGVQLSAEDPIQVEKRDGKVVISITGDVGEPYDVKASSNISVTTAGKTFTVSGKNWQNTITAASSYAYKQATANAQGQLYTGIEPIVVNNTQHKISAHDALLSAKSPIYIETGYYNGYNVNSICFSGLRYASVLGGTDLSDASVSITHERANLPITTDWYQLNISNVSGNTGSFTLIPSDITSGFVWSIGNGGFSTKAINESKIYNHSFTTAGGSISKDLTADGYVEVHLTTPYNYYGQSEYTATLDGQTFTLASGTYANLCWQDVEGSMKWCLMYSGNYSI